MSVDLPAPFSPAMAWTSPGRNSRSTPSTAFTPGKLLVMARTRTTCPAFAAPSLVPSPPLVTPDTRRGGALRRRDTSTCPKARETPDVVGGPLVDGGDRADPPTPRSFDDHHQPARAQTGADAGRAAGRGRSGGRVGGDGHPPGRRHARLHRGGERGEEPRRRPGRGRRQHDHLLHQLG